MIRVSKVSGRHSRGKDHYYVYAAYGKGNTGALMAFGKDEKQGIDKAPEIYRFFVTKTAQNTYLNPLL